MSDLRKRGTVKITNGKYLKDGVEKTRYVTVGEYFATDHNGRQSIKLYATAFSEEKWLNIYLDEENAADSLQTVQDGKYDKDIVAVKAIGDAKRDFVPEDIDDKPIDLSEIPF